MHQRGRRKDIPIGGIRFSHRKSKKTWEEEDTVRTQRRRDVVGGGRKGNLATKRQGVYNRGFLLRAVVDSMCCDYGVCNRRREGSTMRHGNPHTGGEEVEVDR